MNKEEIAEYNREYHSRESVKQKAREYYQEHKEALIFNHQKYQWKIKLAVLRLLGGKCRKCGNADPRVLQVNHINSRNGEREKGYCLYLKILSGKRKTDDLELLCANCNIIYEYEKGITYSKRLL